MSFEERKDDDIQFEASNVEQGISNSSEGSENYESPSFSDQLKNEDSVPESPKEPTPEISTKKPASPGMIVALVIAVAAAAFFAGSYFSNLDSDAVTQSDLDDAISRLEAKLETTQVQPSSPQPVRISIDDDPVRGDPNAPITIIEFSDFQCPFCARFHDQTLPSLLDEYIEAGKVKFVYRDFPIQSLHPNALAAAVAAECANEQGEYWQYHDTLFENQNSWAKLDSNSVLATFSQYAQGMEMEMDQFNSCLGTGKYLSEIQNDLNDGRKYDVTGTPGFFIGNDEIGFVKVDGAQPYETFKQIIDAQLGT